MTLIVHAVEAFRMSGNSPMEQELDPSQQAYIRRYERCRLVWMSRKLDVFLDL